jgi:hypothetical protein
LAAGAADRGIADERDDHDRHYEGDGAVAVAEPVCPTGLAACRPRPVAALPYSLSSIHALALTHVVGGSDLASDPEAAYDS